MRKKANPKESIFTTLIAKNFRLIRLSLGQSREEVGKLFDVSGQQIAKYEDARDRISAAKLFMFAEHNKIPMNEFLNNKNFIANTSQDEEDILDNFQKINRNKYEDIVHKIIKSLDHEGG